MTKKLFKNKLILGTVQLGLNYGVNNKYGKPSLEKSFDILNTAYDNGIRILDTAEGYGDSQKIIGEFQKLHPEKIFNIITKLSESTIITKELLNTRINENLKTLNINELYGYMFHDFNSFKKNDILLKELVLKKKEGKIRYLGISLYSNEDILDIIDKYDDFDFIQIPFNLLDNQLKRKSVLLKAKSKGIQIHTRSVFLQGLFFKNSENLPVKLDPLKEHLKYIDQIKKEYKLITEQIAIQYVLQKTYINFMLIGVDSSAQLLKNLKVYNDEIKIPHELIDRLDVKNEDLLNPSNWT
jgi:aryl-alcohol dehydrogenase-like predicted oxidoreductase